MTPPPHTAILGIEGGGTKTTWALLTPEGQIVKRGEAGPGNTLLLSEAALAKLLGTIRREAGTNIAAIGGAFAGCQLPAEKSRVEKIVRRTWPRAGVVRVMEDTRSVLAAAFGDGPGIAVIAGTGSNVAGQKSADAPVEKAGGWGHLFADRGSGYDLARRGMELAFARYDADKKISPLGREFLAASGLASMEELVPYLLRDTGKNTVAGWAKCVFAAAKTGDREARRLLEDAAGALAEKTAVIARRLKLKSPQVALIGGLFENRPPYLAAFQRALRRTLPHARAFLLDVPGTIGAARVAGLDPGSAPVSPEKKALAPIAEPHRLAAFARASTEQRNPRSRGLDRRSIPRLVDLFIREEREVEKALRAQRNNIAKAATLVAKKLGQGGRLFYVGAGTSGRLGVVDASEMPPTFNAAPEEIQAIMAGGPAAVFKSQEGAEDNRAAGAAELRARKLGKRDVVCGIAAGAGAILLSCNPNRAIRVPVDVAIDLPTGPEIVTGSTRLKAGTATKLVLNMLSTIAMVRLGRVRDNLMINVQATNDKLRARAVRLVAALSGASFDSAQAALEKNGWRVAVAAASIAKR
jgi:N-acetylmuramic acid 6-phosphate etherase